jgi:predicted NBD/HSP70 family sugar kinase
MNYFAVDAGGTEVKWAVISPEYEILEKGSFPSPTESADLFVEQIAKVVREQRETFTGIGLSVPGTLRGDEDGMVEGGGMLTYLDGVPLGKKLREKCGIPVYVENDGKCCALGEYASGALKGSKVGAVMVLGTGVGGGIVLDGKVFRGAHCFAGEFSFLQLHPMATGDPNSLFGFVGGWKCGLLARVLKEKNLPEDTAMDGYQIFELINAGDEAAIRALEQYAAAIAQQIWNVQAMFDPDVIAIGGGISRQPKLIETIQKALDTMVEENPLKQFPTPHVVPCIHGNDANLLGAVYQCRQRI